MKVAGQVDRIFTKDWRGRNGNVTLYSFKVRGNDQFFRLGEKKPDFRETDSVEFNSDEKGNVSDLIVTKAPAKEVPTSAATSGYSAPVSKDEYWANKDKRQEEVVEPRICFASAQSDAVALVNAALQHDLLAFGNANKSAKLGLLLDYVDQVTLRFAKQRMDAANIINGVEPEPDYGDDSVAVVAANSDLG